MKIIEESLLILASEIQADPDQHRQTMDDEKMAAMMAGMRKYGYDPARGKIEVRVHPGLESAGKDMFGNPDTPHKYMGVDGNRRITAIHNLQVEEHFPKDLKIEVRLREFENNAELREYQLSQNLLRDDPDPVEVAVHVKSQLDQGADIQSLAVATGRTVASLKADLNLANLAPPYRRMVSDGDMSIRVARLLGELDYKRQEQCYDKHVSKNKTAKGQLAAVKRFMNLIPGIGDAEPQKSTEPVVDRNTKAEKRFLESIMKTNGRLKDSPYTNGSCKNAIKTAHKADPNKGLWMLEQALKETIAKYEYIKNQITDFKIESGIAI